MSERPAAERGRRIKCPTCHRLLTIRPGDVWVAKLGGKLRIVSVEQDGAIVEQVDREGIEPRWGISYRDLQRDYDRERES